MRFFALVCLVGFARANFLDTVGHALGGIVDTVGDGVVDAAKTAAGGVVDAAQTVGHGVETAANAVAGVLPDVASALGTTFQDVWNVAKDPLKEAGEQLLKDAAKMALEQGVALALDALASGKRELPDRASVRAYLTAVMRDEFQHWLKDSESQILGSKDELTKALSTLRYQELPSELKDFITEYSKAKGEGKVGDFIGQQASIASQHALASLKSRITDRINSTIMNMKKGIYW